MCIRHEQGGEAVHLPHPSTHHTLVLVHIGANTQAPSVPPGDLTCIWHELKAVQLRTLNRERAEMVIERWVRRGTAPDAAEVGVVRRLQPAVQGHGPGTVR